MKSQQNGIELATRPGPAQKTTSLDESHKTTTSSCLSEEEEMEVLPANLPNILQNEILARKLSQQDNRRGIGFGRATRQTRHHKQNAVRGQESLSSVTEVVLGIS